MARIMKSAIFVLVSAVAMAQPQPQKPLARLQSNIENLTHSVNAKWAIYVKCLETGEEIAMNADEPMETMSVIKIPLMTEAFRQIEAGKFSLTDRIELTDAAKRPGTGVIRSLDAGANLTIKDLLTLMIIVSDNTATDYIYGKVGGAEPVNRLMQDWGLKTIRASGPAEVWFKALNAAGDRLKFHESGEHPFGLTSARDMGKLLEKIKRGDAVSKKSSEMMMQMLRGQVYATRMPKYVTGYRVAHKTGDFLPYVGNDVGVLESRDRNIIVCIFDAHHTGSGAYLEDAIGRITELIGNYFAQEQ